MPTVLQDPQLVHLLGKCQDAVSVAAVRGYQTPDEYVSADRVAKAAEKVAQAPTFHPGTAPTDPRKVPGWVTATAEARLLDREERTIAADLADSATRTVMRSVLGAVPSWVELLRTEFSEAAAKFGELLLVAPRSVSGRMDAQLLELHRQLLRSVEDMTALAFDRARLGDAVGEGEHVGSDPLWLVIDPAPTTYLGAVTQTLVTYSGRLPSTIEEWQQVAGLGLGMAGPGEVVTRKERHAAARHASAQAPDGGQVDKRYDEVHALAGAGAPA